ncbi:MAG: universal stress protein, partial [Elusimicrobia bacterium]|nr:universal stress protein [Elusimicrobiota bacterium]
MTTQEKAAAAARTAAFPPKSILVPLDFTESSRAGLGAAARLAGHWSARVRVVHVDEGPPPSLLQDGEAPATRAAAELYEATTRRRLEEAAAECPGASTELIEGAPSVEVARLAAEGAADLVVMGAHGARGLKRFLGGSTAERALHAAHVPVLAVQSFPGASWPRRVLAPV